MFEKEIRWGVIGCGSVMQAKSGPAYQQVNGFSLHRVMARTLATVEQYALARGVPYFSDNANDIIAADDIDAVYIATPPDSHFNYAMQVAAAGKPCCIEKPLSNNYADSQRVVQAFEAANTPLFVAYYRRYLPRFLKVKAILEAGYIGNVKQVSWILSKPPRADELSGTYRWHTDTNVARGGYFEDIGSHGINLLQFLLGDMHSIEGVARNTLGLYPAADAVVAYWQHANGVIGSGNWNFTVGCRKDEVTIAGDKGFIRFSVFDDTVIRLETSQSAKSYYVEHYNPVQLGFVRAMRDSLLFDQPNHCSGRDALASDAAIHHILQGY